MYIEMSSMKAGMNGGMYPLMLFVLCSLLFYFLLEENKSSKIAYFYIPMCKHMFQIHHHTLGRWGTCNS